MNKQTQWLFEAPSVSESALHTKQENYRLPEWEADRESKEVSLYALGEQEWEQSPSLSSRGQTIRETIGGFSRHSNAIPLQERAKIVRLAQMIVQSHKSKQPIRTVRLVGHADRDVQRGAIFEKKISGDRAFATQQALMHAINNRTISSEINWQRVARGASQRIVKNPTTEQARSHNRRVGLFLATAPSNNQQNTVKWTTRALAVTLQKTVNLRCVGTASPGFISLLSRIPDCNGTCGGPVMERFKIFFHVDADIVPRPQPFQPPRVSVMLEVITAQGRSKFTKQESDSTPSYQGAGSPLRTSFGEDFVIPLAPGDTLRVNLQMHDPSSSTIVNYSDNISIIKLPCI